MQSDVEQLTTTLDQLDGARRIRRDDAGRVIGSAGLSVVPDRHQLSIDDRTFWTWCAYDILGIMGALKASGRASSQSPASRARIELEFRDGAPQASGVVLFRPDDSFAACCTNIYEEWCPNSNFFEDEDAAHEWSSQRGIDGLILSLDDASTEACKNWESLVGAYPSRDQGAEDQAVKTFPEEEQRFGDTAPDRESERADNLNQRTAVISTVRASNHQIQGYPARKIRDRRPRHIG